jgi:hypothetical protein
MPSPRLSAAGQPVSLTVQVQANVPSSAVPTGTVIFMEGSTTLGTATLDSSGLATFTSSALSAGIHMITAFYQGTSDFLPSSDFDLPTLCWNGAPAAHHYSLRVVDAATGAAVINQPCLLDTLFNVSKPLTPGRKYTWSVGAYHCNGQTGTWSSKQTFTLARLAAPSLSGAGGTIAVSSGYDQPTFSWDSVTGADHYALSVVDTSTGKVVINNATVSTTSFTPSTPLTPGHSFTWRVAACSTNGQSATWSSNQTFKLAALAQPTLTAPSGTIEPSEDYYLPTFTWNAVSGAHHYYLKVVDATTGKVVINNATIATTTFTPSTPLTPGHSFTWRVAACSANGQGITWSSTQKFTLAQPAAPVLSGPKGTIAASSGYDRPTFSWSSVSGADSYSLYVVDTTTGKVVIDQANVTACSYTSATPLTPGHSYMWCVGAYYSFAQGYVWSSGLSFKLA